MNLRYRNFFLLLLVAVLGLGGCATTKSPRMAVEVEASYSINPDRNGRASPVVLYVYYLQSSSTFDNARYIALATDAADILGRDLLSVREIEVSPGQSLSLATGELPEATRYVGVVGAFRDIDNAQWRGSVMVKKGEKFKLDIFVDDVRLFVTKD
ncbi:MAG: type VI secretion system lipoprotein TssJ [Pseudomonadota bacterium]